MRHIVSEIVVVGVADGVVVFCDVDGKEKIKGSGPSGV